MLRTQSWRAHQSEVCMLQSSETIPSKGSEELVERKYTPISPVDQLGSFELLIKIYRPCERFPLGGKLTSWLEEKFNAQQSDKSLRVSGPFGRLVYLGEGNTLIKVDNRQRVKRYKRIVMIAGGTGITPLYQVFTKLMPDHLCRFTKPVR